jgi:hypothetical protein
LIIDPLLGFRQVIATTGSVLTGRRAGETDSNRLQL